MEYCRNLLACKQLIDMVKPIGQPSSKTLEIHAFWNPVIGGQFLLFAIYIYSIGLGSVSIDNISQLRFTLHLYNEFKEKKLIVEESESLLVLLDNVFHNRKAIWIGGRPKQEKFKTCFLFSYTKRIMIRPEDYSTSCKRIINRDFS